MKLNKGLRYRTDGEIALTLEKTSVLNNEIPVYRYRISLYGKHKKLGVIDLIVGYNETVKYCGNIGCTILKPYRGNNYAQKAVAIIQQLVKEIGLNKIIITCSPDNLASNRICEKMGYRYIETIHVPDNKKTCAFQEGQREICRYEYDLNEYK